MGHKAATTSVETGPHSSVSQRLPMDSTSCSLAFRSRCGTMRTAPTRSTIETMGGRNARLHPTADYDHAHDRRFE
eukprot:8456847-Pyramimonas_sp.AAC.1